MKNQAVDALSRLETRGKDYADVNDDLPVVFTDHTENICEASKVLSWTMFRICDNDEQQPGNMIPGVQSYVQKQETKWEKPPKLKNVIAAHAQYMTCQQFGASADHPDSKFHVDSNRFLVRQSTKMIKSKLSCQGQHKSISYTRLAIQLCLGSRNNAGCTTQRDWNTTPTLWLTTRTKR